MLRPPSAITIFIVVLCRTIPSAAEDREARLARIPRVDVHAHVGGDVKLADRLLEIGRVLKEQHGANLKSANLEIWIDLGSYRRLKKLTVDDFDAIDKKYQGRLLPCISDYRIADGLQYSPEEIRRWHDRGIAGYKIWVGVSGLCDTPANEATYTELERLGMVGASVHVAQPYPTKWCTDIIKFWEAQNAWERVLDRHPKMTVVMAHMMNYNMTDEQFDSLRYVMQTYPNVHLDLAARIGWLRYLDREKIRQFIIRYQDRILFGTDVSASALGEQPGVTAMRYRRCFAILETDHAVPAGFYPPPVKGKEAAKGLALPIDVLESIYYRNAARLYPRVGEVLKRRGYSLADKPVDAAGRPMSR